MYQYVSFVVLSRSELTGIRFADGFVFLQRFYSIYNYDKAEVGLASTAYSRATVNWGETK